MTTQQLQDLSACEEAVEYYATKKSFEQAWHDCQRGDWMLWIASKLRVDKRTLFLAKARCAKTVLHLMKDRRSIKAVEFAELYGLNDCSDSTLKLTSVCDDAAAASYYAADAAADAVNAADAANADASDESAAAAAAAAAYAAYYAAHSCPASAASAAYHAAVAAYCTGAVAAYCTGAHDAAGLARKKNRQLTADICRMLLSKQVFEKVQKL